MHDKPIFVFLPACDEANHIEELITQLKQLKLNLKIHVIDDGSQDATGKLAQKAGAIVLRHPVNLGQWAALRTAFTISLLEDAHVMVSVDADGQHDPMDLAGLLEPILDGNADIVIGSRFLEDEHPEMPLYRHVGIRLFNRLLELLTKKQLTDCTSGYRAYNMSLVRKILPNLRENQYGALEFISEAVRQRARIVEAPIAVRTNSVSKKGKVQYGYNLLRTLLTRG